MQWVHSQCNVTLVQLINVPTDFIGPTNETFAQLLQQLPLIKSYAWGIGPWKSEIVPQVNSTGGSGGTSLLADTTLIKGPAPSLLPYSLTPLSEAHALGLKVFAWTFRSDAFYLNAQYHGSWEEVRADQATSWLRLTPRQEYFRFARAGLDGFITDFTDNAVTALNAYAEQEQGALPAPPTALSTHPPPHSASRQHRDRARVCRDRGPARGRAARPGHMRRRDVQAPYVARRRRHRAPHARALASQVHLETPL